VNLHDFSENLRVIAVLCLWCADTNTLREHSKFRREIATDLVYYVYQLDQSIKGKVWSSEFVKVDLKAGKSFGSAGNMPNLTITTVLYPGVRQNSQIGGRTSSFEANNLHLTSSFNGIHRRKNPECPVQKIVL
jgi:hypothetical protein